MIIGHYDPEIWANGGIASYIRRIGQAQQLAGHQVYYFSRQSYPDQAMATETPIVVDQDRDLFAHAKRLGLDILHCHREIVTPPPSDLPIIRTLHGHQPYCPSGTRYLQRLNQPCDRAYSFSGCLWGHLMDGCGSRRLQNIYSNFQLTQQEMAILPRIPVITVSHFLKQQMIQSGYPSESIHVLHLFAPEVATVTPPPKESVPHFVFLGRLSPQKGVDWLLRAIQKVTVPVHLDIAGEGYYGPQLRQLAEKLQLADKVTFHGWVSPEQANQFVQASRALIFPSLWHEPGGTVAFEAMTNGRAVIMSRVGGMPEVVLHDVNGLLVEPNQVDALARSIERLATDWFLANELGETGRAMAKQRFTLNHHLEQLTKIYTSL